MLDMLDYYMLRLDMYLYFVLILKDRKNKKINDIIRRLENIHLLKKIQTQGLDAGKAKDT